MQALRNVLVVSGLVCQIAMISIAIWQIFFGSLVGGLFLIAPSLIVDWIVTANVARSITKILLFFQGIMVLLVITQPADDSSDLNSAMHIKTNSITNKTPQVSKVTHRLPKSSSRLLQQSFGPHILPVSTLPDLQYHSPEHIREELTTLFSALPERFLPEYKNPCWRRPQNDDREGPEKEFGDDKEEASTSEHEEKDDENPRGSIVCLPYVYILGQPKCGSTDLYARIAKNPEVAAPQKKEIRWFTRGEFTRSAMEEEGEDSLADIENSRRWYSRRMGSGSSIYSYTNELAQPTEVIEEHPSTHITIDGGPHTLWWPTQSPDGSIVEGAIPPAQILRELQPNAKFIITLQDPVRRMYSDYHFLDKNLLVHDMNVKHGRPADQKDPRTFHMLAVAQVTTFKQCVVSRLRSQSAKVKSLKKTFSKWEAQSGGKRSSAAGAGIDDLVQRLTNALSESQPPGNRSPRDYNYVANQNEDELNVLRYWFRASQECAHDRKRFAAAGTGRLAIGLYSLFYEKWLEHWDAARFLVLKLEDFDSDPRAYMSEIFKFLDLAELEDEQWEAVLKPAVRNRHREARLEMLPETRALLRAFYRPYNEYLSVWVGESFKFIPEEEEEEEEEEREGEGGEGGERSAREVGPEDDDDEEEKEEDAGTDEQGSESEAGDGEEKVSEGMNHHGTDRMRSHVEHSHEDEPELPHTATHKKANLRAIAHSLDDDPYMKLTPKAFSLEGLPAVPPDFNGWISRSSIIDWNMLLSLKADKNQNVMYSTQKAAMQLCTVAFSLDVRAVKVLLYDIGFIPSLVDRNDSSRNAFNCLSLVPLMAEAHPQSHVFTLLKNKTSYLSEYIVPPVRLPAEPHSQSVYIRDVVGGLDEQVVRIAKWLRAAGVPPDHADSTGSTPLHHAAASGQVKLLQFLLEQGVRGDVANSEGRTPLHYALFHGHAHAAEILVKAGASLHTKDEFNVSPMDLASTPGAISAAEAQEFLGVSQRGVKRIRRLQHPELHPKEEDGWPAGTGDWGTTRLKGHENVTCDIDQYDARHEAVTGKLIFDKYIAQMKPVLIRGLFDDWKATDRWSHHSLLAERGRMRVSVSDIPYSEKFGGHDHADMTLKAYIDELTHHRMLGGTHPWYVFKSHPIPKLSDGLSSVVPIEQCPTPDVIQEAFSGLASDKTKARLAANAARADQMDEQEEHDAAILARQVFINAQWAIGGEGTGAPVHFHNGAWNALVYGAKKWLLYPPKHSIMSNRQILDFFETDLIALGHRGVHPLTCVQTAGDIIVVPEAWAHGVLNLQESVAIATESRFNEFRMRPWGPTVTRAPIDNRKP